MDSRFHVYAGNPLCQFDTSIVEKLQFKRAGESSSGRTADSGRLISYELVSNFLASRRQGLSSRTIRFYQGYLNHSIRVIGTDITGKDIQLFLDFLGCSDGGKHSYYRALRTFYRWLYSRKSGCNLNPYDNPILDVEPPKVGKRLLPSVTSEQVEILMHASEFLRDRCIISLFADSGMRLSELSNIEAKDINWESNTITIIGKGNKQRRAPFTEKTATMLKEIIVKNHSPDKIWDINQYGIQQMLERLEKATGVKCNPHAFRRGFACNLHRKGLSTLSIMHLGGWEDLSMVLRYTRSITFDDCLVHYRQVSEV